jgi:hypothetical protein
MLIGEFRFNTVFQRRRNVAASLKQFGPATWSNQPSDRAVL